MKMIIAATAKGKAVRAMDNPCKHCDKANPDFVNECEYGCDNPCQSAKDFYRVLSRQLDDLLKRAKDILAKGE